MSRPRKAQALAADEIHRLCQFLHRRTGMIFGESKRYYIERRIADRMAATGTRSFNAYFAHVDSNGWNQHARNRH